jgi:N-acetyl-anhydromuramyl-L-alanine amidase AmpD
MKIVQDNMPASQYLPTETKKTQLIIHGTAGSCRPDYTVQSWEQNPERVGTHFVIGGMSSSGDTTWDGVVYQAVPLKNDIYHLGLKTNNPNGIHDRQSIGIEICNWLPLTKSKDGKFLNYVNKEVPASQVCTLATPYRGFTYYHALTERQLVALNELITYIGEQTGIVIPKRVFTPADFEYNPVLASTQTISFHTNWRTDKTDLACMPNLIESLNTLCA